MLELPKLANLECFDQIGINHGIPIDFGLHFEPEGNITFTYNEGRKGLLRFIQLCSPFLFLIKDLVKRTHFSAIPILVDDNSNQKIKGFDENLGPFFSSLYNNETDIYLSFTPITQMIGSFVGISSFAIVEPIITILGGIYQSQESDSYFGALRIFEGYFYILSILSTLIVSIIMSIEVRKSENSLKIVDIYMREIRLLIETTFFRFSLKNYRTFRYLTIYCIYLITGFVILSAFSNCILSTTIRSSYTFIDSIKDLMAREDLITLVHLSEAHISLIRKSGSESEKYIIEKALEVNEHDFVNDDIELIQQMDDIYEKIACDKTHVFISLSGYLGIIYAKNPSENFKTLHTSDEKYFDHLMAHVFNKNSNKFVTQKYNDILYDVNESGLYEKWKREIQTFGSKVFEDWDKKLPKIDYKSANHVVKIKPALGPFFVGVFTSIIIFLFEISILKKFLKTITNANKLFMKRRNKV